MLVSSPRTWGCFSYLHSTWRARRVFPTHVGVFLSIKSSSTSTRCLPHARGGVSKTEALSRLKELSSPRTWGCFPEPCPRGGHWWVFPTHVGVFPMRTSAGHTVSCLPHARGGVSQWINNVAVKFGSSPRTWGCFLRRPAKPRHSCVFPTHVGVFLDGSKVTGPSWRLPHARGGVSAKWKPVYRVTLSSPRTWGCFF